MATWQSLCRVESGVWRDAPASTSGENDMWIRFLTAALLAFVLAGSAAAQTNVLPPAPTPTTIQLFRSVQRQVLNYPHFSVFDSVNAKIQDGTVTLTGKVTMPYKRKDLEERVSSIKGLKGVNNQIEVLPASKSDDELRVGIANAIYGNSAFVNYATQVNPPIHIVVERGRVVLEGVVANQVDRALAYSIASMFQAFSVKNALRTEEEVKKELAGL
jgi:hyperosmotically inducible protein